LVCGTLGEKYGWGWGFGAAGVGMLIGLINFLVGQKRLKHVNIDQPSTVTLEDGKIIGNKTKLTSEEMSRIWALLIMALFTVFFWMAFEQAGNTMTLWADQNTRRQILGWETPASWFQSVNPFFIFALAPVLSTIWLLLSRRWRDVSSTSKFVLGLIFLGL